MIWYKYILWVDYHNMLWTILYTTLSLLKFLMWVLLSDQTLSNTTHNSAFPKEGSWEGHLHFTSEGVSISLDEGCWDSGLYPDALGGLCRSTWVGRPPGPWLYLVGRAALPGGRVRVLRLQCERLHLGSRIILEDRPRGEGQWKESVVEQGEVEEVLRVEGQGWQRLGVGRAGKHADY